jgi:hypothetical protein
MKSASRVASLLALVVWLTRATLLLADTEKIEFQGRVTAVDPAAKTISIRARQKEYVFSIDPQRCNIVKEGLPGTLTSAQAGDAAVGHLQVEASGPVVTRLFLTAKPEPGVRVKEKPGFITSPYHSNEPPSHTTEGRGAIDARGYQRGSMLVDQATGKIFLIP